MKDEIHTLAALRNNMRVRLINMGTFLHTEKVAGHNKNEP